MDDDEEPFALPLFPPNLRWYVNWYVIRVIVWLVVVIGIGYWQLIVTVADHQRGQPGDGLIDGPCRASTPDAAGCRLPREAD